MRKQVRTIKPDEPVSMAKEMFRRYDIHHLVVVEKKDVVGIIGDRDVMNASSDDTEGTAQGERQPSDRTPFRWVPNQPANPRVSPLLRWRGQGRGRVWLP